MRAITFSPDDLGGRTFLKQPKEDGQRFRARIVRKIIEMEENGDKIKFLVKLPDEEQDEIWCITISWTLLPTSTMTS